MEEEYIKMELKDTSMNYMYESFPNPNSTNQTRKKSQRSLNIGQIFDNTKELPF